MTSAPLEGELEITGRVMPASNATFVGTSLSCSSLWPRPPNTPLPHVHTLPSVPTAAVCARPAAT